MHTPTSDVPKLPAANAAYEKQIKVNHDQVSYDYTQFGQSTASELNSNSIMIP